MYICHIKCNIFIKNKICKECSNTRLVKKLQNKFDPPARPKAPLSSSKPNRIALVLEEEQQKNNAITKYNCMHQELNKWQEIWSE